jgi:hypothetical protein
MLQGTGGHPGFRSAGDLGEGEVVWACDIDGHGDHSLLLSDRRHPSPEGPPGARLPSVEFAGFIAEDAPDPREARLAMIAGLGVPAAGLVAQRHLEDRGEAGHSSSRRLGSGVPDEVTIGQTYVLWRNPDDHDDPVNLADLDDELRRTLDAPLERPVPEWMHEARRMLRYPRLWEAVQTHWSASEKGRRPVAERLIDHAEYTLSNRFREQLGLEPMEWVAPIPPAALQPCEVLVDGVQQAGLLLDTDPFVLGLGTELADGRVLTAVLPRDLLPWIVLEFASDVPLGGARQQD